MSTNDIIILIRLVREKVNSTRTDDPRFADYVRLLNIFDLEIKRFYNVNKGRQ